MTIRRVYKAMC